ncbi:MAG: GntR family transcriptional regulator [Alphaproteobacteria bacterium]|nr:GntR family transcriptional regulator [Alphaproteobacteria bacterium]
MAAKGSSENTAALVGTDPGARARPAARRANSAPGSPAPSLRAQAYEAIKRRITTLDYAPGEHLNEAAIAKQLGIGRTPVHQALDRLMLEGMIDIIPRKGVIVRPVSLDEHLQLTQVRLINEPYCASLAAERADADEINAMRASLDRAHGRMDARDVAGMMDLDRDFHASISRAARNRVLADVLRGLHERSLRFWFISLSDPHHHKRVQREHEAVFRAIRDRDPDRAADAARAHIESSRDNIMKSI